VSIGLTEIGIVIAVCLITAVIALGGLTFWMRGRFDPAFRTRDGIVIRLVRGRVVEADPAFLQLLSHWDWDGSPQSLRSFFAFRFRGLPSHLFDGSEDFDANYKTRDGEDAAILHVSQRKGVQIVSLQGSVPDGIVPDHVMRFRAHSQWLAGWVTRSSPNPVWVVNDDDRVIWANQSYRDLAHDLGRPDNGDTCLLKGLDPSRGLPDREQRRFHLRFGDGRPDRWLDVMESIEKGLRMQHAVDVTAVVQAEVAQRTFVQTLTKTFAQLSIGLAIFDRTRQLALFNPALVDLTGLSAEYLSGRPGYLSFFDKLREGSIMPEPRNYANWREKILDLIGAAEDGRYQETWTLPSGQTYRITGRPHPNGAVAFLVEDISAEVTLTRRFRQQLDMSNSVIESLDEAVAVFSPQGVLSYTNAAYRELWRTPEDGVALDQTVSDATRNWQEQCDASPVWGDFRDFVVGFEERAEWDASVRLRDGRRVDCRFRPLNGGATLATFRAAQALHAVDIQGVG